MNRPCEIPATQHEGAARLYPCGWRCSGHAPQTHATASTATQPAAAPPRLAPKPQPVELPEITGGLRIGCGEGFEAKGRGPGEFWWKTDPRARYQCLDCGWTSETVVGFENVQAFVRHIRTTHRATCSATTTEGAHAA